MWFDTFNRAKSGAAVKIAFALAVLGAPGCEGQDDSGDSRDGGPDTAQMDAVADANDTSRTDARGDAVDATACEDPPECEPGERVVGCDRCVSEMNRVCESDRDCRPEETCEEFDRASVCIYEPEPVETCPGSEGCSSGSDGPLKAAAASRVVTPKGFERPKPEGVGGDNYINFSASEAPDDKWHDCGRDGLCPGDEGYEGPDEGEDDGIPQGMWLAGFGSGRPAQYCPDEKVGCSEVDCCVSKYAHDNLKVQVAVLQRGDTTVAFASLDAIGWFHSDIEEIRERLPDDLGIDFLLMSATHVHEAPDTAGQWGPGDPIPERSGRSPKFLEKIYSQTVDGIQSAVNELEPAKAEAAVVDEGIEGLAMGDGRPPYIFDDNIPVVRLTAQDSGEPIGTMLSLGSHPEVLWDDNPYITSDYSHYVRKYVREGLEAVRDSEGNVVKPALDGFGGVTVFFPGALGGLIGPGGGGALTYGGEEPADKHSFEAADAVGQQVAKRVLSAYDDGQFEEVSDPTLSFARKEFLAPLQNKQFQLAAFEFGVIERDAYNAARITTQSYAPGPPKVLTEVSAVRLGDVTWFTGPGEAFPETLTGGFPGKPTAQDPVVGDPRLSKCDEDGLPVEDGSGSNPCIVKSDQENPPDWEKAPDPPYLYDKVPGDHPFFIGLGGDFLGYIVPEYDYEYDNFSDEAPGEHYEETVGIGKVITGKWQNKLDDVLGSVPN